MSNARNLALLEKWTETSTTPIPTLSPTSPKVTTFCCCPQRRRYNLKQSKKQKNHTNNISDFAYIVVDDDTKEQHNNISSSSNNSKSGNNCCITPAKDIVSDTEILQSNLNKSEKLRQRIAVQNATENTKASNNTNNETANVAHNKGEQQQQQQKIIQSAGEQWLRHDKGCQQYNNSSSSSQRRSNNTSSNGGQHHSCSCSCEQQTATTWTTAQQEEEDDDDKHIDDATQTIPNNCENGQNFVVATIAAAAATPFVEHQETKPSLQQQEQQQHDYQCDRILSEKQQQQHLQQEKIQRLSNNINNKENKISNSNSISNKNNINSNLTEDDDDDANNCCHINKSVCCNFCQQLQKIDNSNNYDDIIDNIADNDGKSIEDPNKMTITTTTTKTTASSSNRKHSECGLTPTATTPTEKETTATTATTTPSMTTVIKTTMVKRSPNESTTAVTSTTTTTAEAALAKYTNQKGSLLQNENSNSNKNSKCLESVTTSTPTMQQQQPTVKSVKERIAAFAAGNDQMKNHDTNNKIPRKNQWNSNSNANMTTVNMPTSAAATTTAISTSNSNNSNSLSNSQKRATSPISTASLSSLSSAASTSTTGSSSNTSSGAASPAPAMSANQQSDNICNNRNNNNSNNTSTDDILLLQKCHTTNDVVADTTTTANAINLRSAARANDNRTVRSMAVTNGNNNSNNNTGSATMPRRRSPAATAAISNERMKYGSNSGAMTADKKFLSYAHKTVQQNADQAIAAATTTTTTPTKTLAALDNLDLALSLDLNDEDGEDPYFALQEYLERVKHEINEVFELHKARQRIQQQQQQQHEDHVDELTRSTESDSGFDSASGHANKLPKRAATTANKVTEISAVNSTNDINGHAVATIEIPDSSSNNMQLRLDVAAAKTAAAAATTSENDDEQTTPTTTNLHALPPPPLSPTTPTTAATTTTTTSESNNHNNTNASSTLKRLRKQLQAKADAAVAVASSCSSAAAADEVNVWANKFLRDLDNLMGSDNQLSASASTSSSTATSPMLLSAAATAAINSRCNGKSGEQRDQQSGTNGLVVLRPEKHATIPLQSFNLDCGGTSAATTTAAIARPNAATIAYLRTLSAPTPYHHQPHQHNDNRLSMANGNCKRSLATLNGVEQQHHHSLANFECATSAASTHRSNEPTTTTTILKIEEAAAAAAIASASTLSSAVDDDGGVHAKNNKMRTESTSLADEELQRQRRQRQLENDMETIRNTLLSQNQQLAAMEVNSNNSDNHKPSCNKNTLVATTATLLPKRERFNQALNTATTPAAAATTTISPSSTLMTPSKTNGQTTATTTTTSYLLNGNDATKKGSTSTIWTSEESILRSVGAVDEDNNSTSSSACEEASGVLSSGKSGISLDSSGLDNDNNESGIGTATPPKDLPYWKNSHNHHHHHHHNNDNESVSSLDALRKIKFQKASSVASSDDPDLLEVLSLCDEPQGDEDVCTDVDGIENDHHSQQKKQQQKQQQQQHDNDDSNDALGEEDDADEDDDEVDEGHDEFESVTYCDCDYTDGDGSGSGSAGNNSRDVGGNGSSSLGGPTGIAIIPAETNGVVLRRKFSAAPPIMVPHAAAQKCRSHSLDTSSLPSSYQQHYHQLHPLHQHYHPQHHPSHLTRKLHHHLHPAVVRSKERVQLSLALRQEPFQSLLSPTHFHELPSPSSASLHSGHESLGIQELTTKSNSAPLLLKQERKRDDFAAQNLTLRYSRSQSDRYLAEIEAVEACKWLRAAGFPQYAQMYEDHQFPIDLTNVAKDHTNLENDQLQSLYRRLCILNRCANMRLDQSHKAQTPQKEDSDDENFALSENWTFQPHIRRWSRIGEMGLEIPPAGKLNVDKTESSSKESSPDRFEDDDAYDVSGAGLSLTLPGAGGGGGGGDSTDTTLNDSADAAGVRLRRTGSERLKDGAKALLRRVESIKSRRRKRQNRDGIVISGPQALDLSQLGQRSSMRKPDAVYSTPPSPSAVSPMHAFPKSPFFGNELKVPSNSENFLSPNRSSPKRTPTTPRSMRTSPLHFFSNPMPNLREGKSDDSSSYFSDSQESSTGGKLTTSLRKTPSKTRRFLQRTGKVDDIGAHSDSECHQGRKLLIKDANSNTTEVKVKKLTRGGSLNLGKDPKKRDGVRSSSFRSRSTTRKEPKTTDDAEHIKRTPVVRWHSFQMEERPHMIFRKCFSQKIDPNAGDQGIPFAAMSAGQLQIIRKLALVVLTGHMEHYCPTHRSGWNWELPKFIKKIKMPDYKDKRVFGVPLLLILQRTGQTLPVAVRSAFRWLQLNALDQIGLFRKSGVKSRIIKLKELIEYSENSAECMEVFDAQQAYDVADMLKQYFRDLPESLLTTKMSETFAAIFQHLPSDVRLDAVQCAVLLLPDENREILYALLEFLTLVADNSQFNQMTANNLAVCLAPSLFHNSISTGAASVSASPRRRKGAGVPDVKELSEAKASHECLAFMIENYRKIFTATKEKINKCNFGYMEESKPVPLEALGEGMQFHNWRGYLYECTSATIKEGREKTRGWFTITSMSDPSVDIAYKKVGDGHPLRLWRCITEVEGPPKDVLEYIIRQRASWDINLLQSQTIKKLDERTEIFQYAVDGQMTTDFCVLRSWQTDLPRGACVIVETSIEHGKAKLMYGSVRGVVLASRYLIEPCGSGRSRVMHLARVDIKGKTPEWYNKSYGHICSHYLSKIRNAFKNNADGPESKV